MRDFAEIRYATRSWLHDRHVVARIEATRHGLDVRYVVTGIAHCLSKGFTALSIAYAEAQKT